MRRRPVRKVVLAALAFVVWPARATAQSVVESDSAGAGLLGSVGVLMAAVAIAVVLGGLLAFTRYRSTVARASKDTWMLAPNTTPTSAAAVLDQAMGIGGSMPMSLADALQLAPSFAPSSLDMPAPQGFREPPFSVASMDSVTMAPPMMAPPPMAPAAMAPPAMAGTLPPPPPRS